MRDKGVGGETNRQRQRRTERQSKRERDFGPTSHPFDRWGYLRVVGHFSFAGINIYIIVQSPLPLVCC